MRENALFSNTGQVSACKKITLGQNQHGQLRQYSSFTIEYTELYHCLAILTLV